MDGIDGQIEAIEKEIRETPYHKGTEHHIGKLRARISRLRDKELTAPLRRGSGRVGFALRKQGDATVVLIGPPSAGKSTLINKLTNAESKVAPYAFTTVSVIPGMLKYQDAYIQILDVPGLIEGAKDNKGRGREVLSVARGADLLVIMTDMQRPKILETIRRELYKAGIRINTERPNVRVEKKLAGGLLVHTNIRQELDKETIAEVAGEFGIKNAEITVKERLTMERAIDAFSANRVYIPAIYVVNKIDSARRKAQSAENILYISAEKGPGVDELIKAIWDKLQFARVYLVRGDEEPGFNNPMVVRLGESLRDVAGRIGVEFLEGKTAGKIWGAGAKFPAQEVSLATLVQEGMMVRFV